MFTGIIEKLGKVADIEKNDNNQTIKIATPLAAELSPDESVSHNGVCLTVESSDTSQYIVTAIDETLQKTNLGSLKTGDLINLERSLTLQKRIDGHLVQGHVDTMAKCLTITEAGGSHIFTFSLPDAQSHLLVEKGSVAVNGISLTAFNCQNNSFSVAIIPYTYEHTNFPTVKEGDSVNLEFDIIGKYVSRMVQPYQ